ncbi:late embryogenesis abundant protein At5g17165-like [Curcuma longa]|uniref:late embryogenesis abundant protein At5g17165-like n=1 Tax=Curcuma longa TaxID=136217 RepID=UPI003D9E27EC
MAAYLNWRSVAAGSLGKRFLHQIRTASPLPAFASPAISYRSRAVHDSSYDKNVDEHVRPSVVPDYVINDSSSDKYWGPHPTTGVFGPADEGSAVVAGSAAKLVAGPGSGASEVETTVWFRHQEGVDKAPYA